ncbi:hypothetical protein [Herbaspirillum sp. NPDC101396]|uniref:hypothetical protein n=1 Tax=Herbaspirillum sp. NPDC101396 TaxID=3364005 RepID=UPI00383A341C
MSMNTLPKKKELLESQRWFQLIVALAGYSVAAAMGYLVSRHLDSSTEPIGVMLVLLSTWAGLGLCRLLTMFVPLLLVKLWPWLDE